MFERFTDRARRVIDLAEEEARMLSHSYIGTEHLLLGLIHEGEGVAAQVLESLGISLQAVRQQVEEVVGQGQQAVPRRIPFTPRAKKVLELARREAFQLGHGYIGTEHILLGLIREGEGVAALVLAGLGADLNGVRQEVIRLLHGRQGKDGPSTGRGARQRPLGRRQHGLLPEILGEWSRSTHSCRLSGSAWMLGRRQATWTSRSGRRAGARKRPPARRITRTRRRCGTGNGSCSPTRPPASRSGRPRIWTWRP